MSMSLQSCHVLLDPEKVATLKKSGAELSSYLRQLMADNPINPTEGAKIEAPISEALQKKFVSLEQKLLKLDTEFSVAKKKRKIKASFWKWHPIIPRNS